MLLSLSSCIKHYDVKPITNKIYNNEFDLQNWDPDYSNSECFYSLNGCVLSLYNLMEDNSYVLADFGLEGGTIGSPESNLFEYSDPDYNSKKWPKVNKGKFSMTGLTKTDFDALTNIESVKDLAINGKTSVGIWNEAVIAFSLSRGYGLLYVKDLGLFKTRFQIKYFVTG